MNNVVCNLTNIWMPLDNAVDILQYRTPHDHKTHTPLRTLIVVAARCINSSKYDTTK